VQRLNARRRQRLGAAEVLTAWIDRFIVEGDKGLYSDME